MRTGMNLLGAADARILVVDDEPTNTTILERLLRQTGYREVAVLNDSRNAISLYEELRPDIVLLDLHMPGVDGYQLLDQLADPAGAGIREGDLVVRVAGTDVGDADALLDAMAGATGAIEVVVVRGADELTLTADLGGTSRPNQDEPGRRAN